MEVKNRNHQNPSPEYGCRIEPGCSITAAASYIDNLLLKQWLAGFYYQAEINLLVYVSATLMVIVVAFITIATQAYKKAEASPVHALRHD